MSKRLLFEKLFIKKSVQKRVAILYMLLDILGGEKYVFFIKR